MVGPLHLGTPTDRLIVEWWIRRPHVERRIARATKTSAHRPVVRSAEIAAAPAALRMEGSGPSTPQIDLDARRVLVSIPSDFTEMQQTDSSRALAWRLAVREVFTTYFARGYRVVDFWRDENAGGCYLLEVVQKSEDRGQK